ncbi:MAG: Response regulator receiver [Proteobacteria bacterium]|nr:Response regulator receiver [Pseudomonadota bacterium]
MSERLALVVDDHPTNRLLAVALLKKLGWTAQEADSGETAIRLTATRQPQLVLLDISMPGLSGEETCTRLRQTANGAALRIIAYTAHAYPEERAAFLAAGFDDVLVKPISRQRLAELVGGL